jgi:PPOX class probable F420-dependent enzyme
MTGEPLSEPLDERLLGLIAGSREGVLATLAADGRPQLSNVLYAWDPAERIVRISTTSDRAKGRNVRRDPRAALHVSGDHFWQYVVAEGAVTTTADAAEPGDEASRELLAVHSFFYGDLREDDFYQQMIAARRLIVRLHVRRIYGIALAKPPG